jgi:hypothetical protein
VARGDCGPLKGLGVIPRQTSALITFYLIIVPNTSSVQTR